MRFCEPNALRIFSLHELSGLSYNQEVGIIASVSSRDISLLIKCAKTAIDFALNTLAYVIFTYFKGQSVIKPNRTAPW